MKIFALDFLHIFVITVITAFVILCVLAMMGKFDHWSTRFIRRYVFRKKTGIYRNEKIVREENMYPDEE